MKNNVNMYVYSTRFLTSTFNNSKWVDIRNQPRKTMIHKRLHGERLKRNDRKIDTETSILFKA